MSGLIDLSPMERSRERGRADSHRKSADVAQLASAPVSKRRVLALFGPYRSRIALVMSLIVASSAIGLAQPFLVREVIDGALPTQDVRLLVWCVLGMIAVATASALLGVLQTWISTTVGQQIMHGLRADLFSHLQRQSLGFFTRTRTGEVQSRLVNDVGGMQSVVTSTATSIASNVTVVVGTAVAMVALSWRLALLSLLVLPPALWLTRQVARMRIRIATARQRAMADMLVQIDEGLSISAIRLSKTLGSAPAAVSRFTDTSSDLVALSVRSQLAGRWRMATMNIIFATIPALVYLAAGLPATSGGMTIGTLVAFSALQATLFRPLMALLNVGVDITASMALFSRIFEYLDLPVEIREREHPIPLSGAGDVRFEHIGFAYDDGVPVLRDVDLAVPAGTSLALVGETGSGKSTLAALVARLHDVTSGRVLIDGVDVRDAAFADLADAVGMVSQETYLLHASVRDNLLHAKADATDDEVEAACRAAQIHDVIAALPQGYDTLVGSRGHRFSGGEQQRLAIARTLLRDPRILVLDEATSALDNDTEYAVQQALDRLRHGRTTIMVAHRLSTVRDADQIAVLDHGRVVELGSHDRLVAHGGRYAALLGRAEGARDVAA